jgi:P4 family phage/plasmid primase-like protien
MLAQAKGLPAMNARIEDFDVDPLAYNVINGVIRFGQGRDGVWRMVFTEGHRAADMMMQMSAFTYDPAADATHWVKRLNDLHADPVARTALQRIYGYTLTGLISDQKFYIFQGLGNDGKSMTNSVIGLLHGDYFGVAAPATFLQSAHERSGSEHSADLEELRGDIRLVVCDEPPERATWHGTRIKQITGSKVKARGVGAKKIYTYIARWKLIAECNALPKMPGDDKGFRRRMAILPWQISYKTSATDSAGVLDAEAGDVVQARLISEASGILNWMIVGALEWLNERLIPEPAASTLAQDNFWES